MRDLLLGGIVSAGVSLAISYQVIAGHNSQALEDIKTLQDLLDNNQQKIALLERQLAEGGLTANASQPEGAPTAKSSQQIAVPSSDQLLHPLKPPTIEPRNQPTVVARSTLLESRQPIPGDMKQRLLSGGISNTEVESIVSTKRQIQESRLEQTWQYRRQAYLDQPENFQLEVVNPLRARLGDDLYEKYLTAQDRSVAVKVSGVMSQSSADFAGIVAGDEITHYDGERVFHLNELSTLSARKDVGDFIDIEILREGQQMVLTIASGPLGVSMVGGL